MHGNIFNTLSTFVTITITGKRAYEKGLYQDSVRLFEKALNEEGWMSRLGGDIQLWLALAYQVCLQRHEPSTTHRSLCWICRGNDCHHAVLAGSRA